VRIYFLYCGVHVGFFLAGSGSLTFHRYRDLIITGEE
jgi:hypothetical protein